MYPAAEYRFSLSKDMVVEFAKMNEYELLEETEKTVSLSVCVCVSVSVCVSVPACVCVWM